MDTSSLYEHVSRCMLDFSVLPRRLLDKQQSIDEHVEERWHTMSPPKAGNDVILEHSETLKYTTTVTINVGHD